MTMGFGDLLAAAVQKKRSAVCVGLDPRWKNLPASIREGVEEEDLSGVARATADYCRGVLDAVAEYAAVVKPQSAFFEQLGPSGALALAEVIGHARNLSIPVLLDAKRGDIGSTAEGYAQAYLGQASPWRADALTVNPYLGTDTLEPFHRRAVATGSGIFVLVKTSNPGSGFLQDRVVEGQPLYERVAHEVQRLSEASLQSGPGDSGYGCVGAVVGATYPDQLARLRELMPNAWILIPGFGAQGGTADDVRVGFGAGGLGAVVNSSRGIIFAYEKDTQTQDWQTAVARAAQDMRDQLQAVV